MDFLYPILVADGPVLIITHTHPAPQWVKTQLLENRIILINAYEQLSSMCSAKNRTHGFITCEELSKVDSKFTFTCLCKQIRQNSRYEWNEKTSHREIIYSIGFAMWYCVNIIRDGCWRRKTFPLLQPANIIKARSIKMKVSGRRSITLKVRHFLHEKKSDFFQFKEKGIPSSRKHSVSER